MAKSALLKSSLAKKYWMALTGLFLCLFLAGHLAGNLQLIFGTNLQFNEYALFMTTNPAVKLLSYVTYISILFHAVDGFLLTIQNKKARPVGYAKNAPGANSSFSARNMAVLGSLILIFIVTHMVNFWAKMHFDQNIPLMTKTIMTPDQGPKDFYVGIGPGQYYMVDQVERGSSAEVPEDMMVTPKQLKIVNVTEVYNTQANVKVGQVYKDLHKITFDFFRDAKYGLLYTLAYVLSMFVLAFHLWHGFSSAFQSLGVNNKFTPSIKFIGKAFSVIVPLLFAIIPLFIHFSK